MKQEFIEKKLTSLNEIARDTRIALHTQQEKMFEDVSEDLKQESKRLQHIKFFFGMIILLTIIISTALIILGLTVWKVPVEGIMALAGAGPLSIGGETTVYLIAVKSNENRISYLEKERSEIRMNIEQSITNIGKTLADEQRFLLGIKDETKSSK